jgi:hypothetical protein
MGQDNRRRLQFHTYLWWGIAIQPGLGKSATDRGYRWPVLNQLEMEILGRLG